MNTFTNKNLSLIQDTHPLSNFIGYLNLFFTDIACRVFFVFKADKTHKIISGDYGAESRLSGVNFILLSN